MKLTALCTAAWILVASLSLSVLPGCGEDVQGQLEALLTAYLDAERAGNGEAVLKLIDPKNFEHYDSVVSHAKTGTYEEIKRLEPIDQYWIAVLRDGTTPVELKKLDGRGFVKLWVERRWGGDDKPPITLTDVKHRPPRASAAMVVDGLPTEWRMEFVQVNEQWLINDECFDKLFNETVLKLTRALNRSQDAVLLDFASDTLDKTVQRGVWERPLK
jgi:hypothetical protein